MMPGLKKLLLTTILIFSIIFHAQSQVKKIDSLDKLINKATSDTQRINLKIKKASALSNINLDSAISLNQIIIEEAKAIHYLKGEAGARITLATNYCFSGEFDLAKQNLDISKEILTHTADSGLLARMFNGYGVMYSMQNRFDTSHGLYTKGIQIALLQKDEKLLSVLYQNNAIAYQQESNYPQAIINYQKAMDVAQKANDEQSEAFLAVNLALTYKTLGDYKKAEKSFLKSISLAKKLGLKNVLAYAYANISTLYSIQDDFKK